MGQSPPDASGKSYGTQWSTQLVVQSINTEHVSMNSDDAETEQEAIGPIV